MAVQDFESKIKEIFLYLGGDISKESDKVQGLKTALAFERASYDFYKEQAPKMSDERIRALYEAFMHEEREHYEALDNVLFYLTHPGDWFMAAESARWSWMTT